MKPQSKVQNSGVVGYVSKSLYQRYLRIIDITIFSYTCMRFEIIPDSLWLLIYLTTKETCHMPCVIFLAVNECDAHLSFHCVKVYKGRLRCT